MRTTPDRVTGHDSQPTGAPQPSPEALAAASRRLATLAAILRETDRPAEALAAEHIRALLAA